MQKSPGQHYSCLLCSCLLLLLLGGKAFADSTKQTAITIIIDDLGYSLQQGMRAVSLPGPVTFAVIPHSPHSKTLAEAAHNRGKEIMLHMPMENHQGKPLDPGGLTRSMTRSVLQRNLVTAINSVPYLRGINNHMGSQLTQNSERMNWVMDTVKRHSLYFVDSRTSAHTVAGATASKNKIPNLSRDVFLDNDPSPEAIDAQFKRLIQIAENKGSAVAIGHPHPSTLGYLENVIPKLDAMGIKLVSPSGLLILQATANRPQPDEKRSVASTLTASSTRCTITEQLDRRLVNCG